MVFNSGAETDPPVRIRTASLVDVATPLIISVTLSRKVPESLSGTVSLYESTLSQAWQEIRILSRYLEDIQTYLSYPAKKSRNRVVEAANRLNSNGFKKAAAILINSEFDKWIDPAWSSDDAQALMDRTSNLMAALSRKRSHPLEGGQ
jgi:hypothetical protein